MLVVPFTFFYQTCLPSSVCPVLSRRCLIIVSRLISAMTQVSLDMIGGITYKYVLYVRNTVCIYSIYESG